MYISTTFSNNIFHLVVDRATAGRSRSTGPNDVILSYTGCSTADVAGIYAILLKYMLCYTYMYIEKINPREANVSLMNFVILIIDLSGCGG